MNQEIIDFISYYVEKHHREAHRPAFEVCQHRGCQRARQLEVYMLLTGRYVPAKMAWLMGLRNEWN